MIDSMKILALCMSFTLVSIVSVRCSEQIRIVGSSTVYPFSSFVAEELGATTDFRAPIVEQTGSGGGHKEFAKGIGPNFVDVTNSSRKMKVSEFENNQKNGVHEIIELCIGYDGIAFAHHIENEPIDFTLKDIFLAVAAQVPRNGSLIENPYTNWKEINSTLPDREILIYGPPTTSGTRDAFEELVMDIVSKQLPEYEEAYSTIRNDGIYVPSGENDNLIIQRLVQDRDAIGIFGYSFLEENADKVQGATINGVHPKPDFISSGKYSVSRSLFFYVKKAHLEFVPGLVDFVDLFLHEKMIGSRGYLRRYGLIPLPETERIKMREHWDNRVLLTKSDLVH